MESEKDTVVEPDISVICDIYIIKLALYAEAGVREYWIVDLEQKRILVYRLELDAVVNMYTFNDSIPVGIFENLSIDFEGISRYLF